MDWKATARLSRPISRNFEVERHQQVMVLVDASRALTTFCGQRTKFDAMLEAAIEAGADDVASSEGGHEVYASQEAFREVAKVLEAKFGEPRKAALTWKPQNTIAVDDEVGEKLFKLLDLLNEHDDVQNVYANFEVSDALAAKMSA